MSISSNNSVFYEYWSTNQSKMVFSHLLDPDSRTTNATTSVSGKEEHIFKTVIRISILVFKSNVLTYS